MEFLIIAVSGSIGALCRYGIYQTSRHLIDTQFPWPTLVINLIGCFIAGLIIGLASESAHRNIYTLLSIGFIGSFTTFSAFGVETLTLIESKQYGSATLSLSLNIIGGLALIVLGRAIALKSF